LNKGGIVALVFKNGFKKRGDVCGRFEMLAGVSGWRNLLSIVSIPRRRLSAHPIYLNPVFSKGHR
jgi:hypothetical protein